MINRPSQSYLTQAAGHARPSPLNRSPLPATTHPGIDRCSSGWVLRLLQNTVDTGRWSKLLRGAPWMTSTAHYETSHTSRR